MFKVSPTLTPEQKTHLIDAIMRNNIIRAALSVYIEDRLHQADLAMDDNNESAAQFFKRQATDAADIRNTL